MKKLAIVGSHPKTCGLAPFDDPAWEIWVFNEAAQAGWCKRWDAVFQLHKPEVYRSANNMTRKDHWDWLQQDHGAGKTIWMQERDALVPNSRRYPLEEVLAQPGGHLRWLACSPAFALALAIDQGYAEIGVWGMELSSATEYGYQLRNWQFWCGVAWGQGIDLQIHSGENEFLGYLYGYEGEVQLGQAYFAERAAGLETAWKLADGQLKRTKERVGDALLARKGLAKLGDLIRAYQAAAVEAGTISGALAEAERYAGREDPISKQEMERRAAQAQQEGEERKAMLYTALGKAEYVINVLEQSGNYAALEQARLFLQEMGKHAFDMGGRLGITRENLEYMGELDRRTTAAGGEKTVAVLLGAG